MTNVTDKTTYTKEEVLDILEDIEIFISDLTVGYEEVEEENRGLLRISGNNQYKDAENRAYGATTALLRVDGFLFGVIKKIEREITDIE